MNNHNPYPRSGTRLRIKHALVMLTILMSSIAGASDIHLMPDTRQTWVAKSIELDGVPAAIKSIHHEANLDHVIDYYQHAWSRYGDVHVSERDLQHVIATRHRDKFISLQLSAGPDGTYGMLVVSELPIPDYQANKQLPVPASINVLSTQTHLDGLNQAQTTTLHSRNGVHRMSSDLISHWRIKGWTLTRDTDLDTLSSGRRVEMKNGNERILAFIAQDEQWDNETLAFVIKRQQE